jgi:hypothetical protein
MMMDNNADATIEEDGQDTTTKQLLMKGIDFLCHQGLW